MKYPTEIFMALEFMQFPAHRNGCMHSPAHRKLNVKSTLIHAPLHSLNLSFYVSCMHHMGHHPSSHTFPCSFVRPKKERSAHFFNHRHHFMCAFNTCTSKYTYHLICTLDLPCHRFAIRSQKCVAPRREAATRVSFHFS